MKVDVVVIGTGPAGGMAACRLAESGLKVVILEKCQIPRHKACGGAIPVRLTKFFDWDILPFIESEVSSIRYLYNHTSPKVFQGKEPLFFTVKRSRFDCHLIERAVGMGRGNVILKDGFRVVWIEEEGNAVTVRGRKGDTVHADFIIAADGAFSKTARCLKMRRDNICGLAIDAKVEVTTEVFEREKGCATINFFCLPDGYGWIFPKDGHLGCGVCAWRRRRHPGLPGSLADFLHKSFPSGSIRKIRWVGHPLPFYTGHGKIATKHVCLAGDAASLVDPIMGEGIRFALKSGAMAADVIMHLTGAESLPGERTKDLSPDRNSCLMYQDLIHKGIGKELALLYLFGVPFFLDAPKFFYQQFMARRYGFLRKLEFPS